MEREAELRAGDDSIVAYERWLERRDDAILDEIAAYNEEDCVSTPHLRDWLLGLRPRPRSGTGSRSSGREAAAVGARRRGARPRRDELRRGRLLERAELAARSCSTTTGARRSRSGGRSSSGSEDERGARRSTPRRSAGSSRPGPPSAPAQGRSSTFTFPPQEHKLAPGTTCLRSVRPERGRDRDARRRARRLRAARGPTSRRRRCRARSSPAGRSTRSAAGGAAAARGAVDGTATLPGARRRILRREPPRAPAARAGFRDLDARSGPRRAARRQLPRRPGAARLGEDVDRRAPDRAC